MAIDQALGFESRRACKHKWQPLSFVFETQILGAEGRVVVRQPKTEGGRVYCVCMKCASHTYVVTQWSGFYLGGDQDPKDEP